MCEICNKDYDIDTTITLLCCVAVKKIPKTLINLKTLSCKYSQIRKIPKTLINLTLLFCSDTQIRKIPKTLINLTHLYCDNTQIRKIPKSLINLDTIYCNHTQIKKIPKTLINLYYLYCDYTQIKFIPNTIKNLQYIYCNKNILISPQTYEKELNNKKYLTFTRCQKNYKNKLRLRKLKFAYDPKYIIGHNTKKQLERFFQN
jgi:Leucine-rich repeat (LRR) protein